jgi:hypothetical protein
LDKVYAGEQSMIGMDYSGLRRVEKKYGVELLYPTSRIC